MDVDVLHNSSCEDLSALDDDSIALTVTSPPYWNAIDYDVHSERGEKAWYRTRKYAEGYQDYGEYLDWLEHIFSGVLGKTRPGGYSAIVIGTVLLEGRHHPVPMDLASRLTASGWEFHQDIVWHKCTAGVKRAGVFIQKPYPGYYYPNIMTEYILVFRKPGSPVYQGRSDAEKFRAEVAIDDVFTRDVANNIWHIAPVPPGHLDHPCPFPEEIPYRLIQLYSYPDDVVLDPFAGSGQTLKVARHLARRFVGYETSKAYVQVARGRIREDLSIRPEQLVAKFDKVTCVSPADIVEPGGNRSGGKRVKKSVSRRKKVQPSGA
jgi:site-specific DNA-methyltransferase (adenine-specific)